MAQSLSLLTLLSSALDSFSDFMWWQDKEEKTLFSNSPSKMPQVASRGIGPHAYFWTSVSRDAKLRPGWSHTPHQEVIHLIPTDWGREGTYSPEENWDPGEKRMSDGQATGLLIPTWLLSSQGWDIPVSLYLLDLARFPGCIRYQ